MEESSNQILDSQDAAPVVAPTPLSLRSLFLTLGGISLLLAIGMTISSKPSEFTLIAIGAIAILVIIVNIAGFCIGVYDLIRYKMLGKNLIGTIGNLIVLLPTIFIIGFRLFVYSFSILF